MGPATNFTSYYFQQNNSLNFCNRLSVEESPGGSYENMAYVIVS